MKNKGKYERMPEKKAMEKQDDGPVKIVSACSEDRVVCLEQTDSGFPDKSFVGSRVFDRAKGKATKPLSTKEPEITKMTKLLEAAAAVIAAVVTLFQVFIPQEPEGNHTEGENSPIVQMEIGDVTGSEVTLNVNGGSPAQDAAHNVETTDFEDGTEKPYKDRLAYACDQIKNGNRGAAKTVLDDLLEEESLPEDMRAAAYFNRALCYDEKSLTAMLTDFQAAQRIEDSPEVNYGIAYVRAVEGDYDGAIAFCDRAIELAPDVEEYYWGRGNLYNLAKMPEEAAEDYKKVLELNPDNERARKSLCTVETAGRSAGKNTVS